MWLTPQSADEAAQPAELALGVRGIAQGEVQPRGSREHRLAMAEGLKRVPAVVSAHAAGADAAERQTRHGELQHAVVDADRARLRLLDHATASIAALRE